MIYYEYSPNQLEEKAEGLLQQFDSDRLIHSKPIDVYAVIEKCLDFVVSCRRGIEHSYDIVEGPMADDQIWNFVEGFMSGRISRAAFWELVKFNYPTHQIVFCSQEALKTLTFEGSETL